MNIKLTDKKFALLLYLYEKEAEACTVTQIGRHFQVTKSTISRNVDDLIEQGLINDSPERLLRLSPNGMRLAQEYAREVEDFGLWIERSAAGTDARKIKENAMVMSLNLEPEIKKQILSKIRLNYIFFKDFPNGPLHFEDFAQILEDGEYPVSFVIFRENYKKDKHFSMSDEAFRHPASLKMKKGEGTIELQAVTIERRNMLGYLIQRGKLMNMDFEGDDGFEPAVKDGDFYMFPANVLEYTFHEKERMLVGSCRVRFYAPLANKKVHVRSAVFSIILKEM